MALGSPWRCGSSSDALRRWCREFPPLCLASDVEGRILTWEIEVFARVGVDLLLELNSSAAFLARFASALDTTDDPLLDLTHPPFASKGEGCGLLDAELCVVLCLFFLL